MGRLQLSVKIWQKEKYPRLSLFDNSLFSQVDWMDRRRNIYKRGPFFRDTL